MGALRGRAPAEGVAGELRRGVYPEQVWSEGEASPFCMREREAVGSCSRGLLRGAWCVIVVLLWIIFSWGQASC
jgi:hypothetical protein